MCAIVIVEDFVPIAPRWDRDRVAIVVGQGLDYFGTLQQVRAMLAYLGAPQIDSGATCWCGEYIEVPRDRRVPRQITMPLQKEVWHAP
jgi:transposase-like protein